MFSSRLTFKSATKGRRATQILITVSSPSLLQAIRSDNHLGRVTFASRPFVSQALNLPRTLLDKRSMSVFNASRLAGKTVLLTGASSGIGAVR